MAAIDAGGSAASLSAHPESAAALADFEVDTRGGAGKRRCGALGGAGLLQHRAFSKGHRFPVAPQGRGVGWAQSGAMECAEPPVSGSRANPLAWEPALLFVLSARGEGPGRAIPRTCPFTGQLAVQAFRGRSPSTLSHRLAGHSPTESFLVIGVGMEGVKGYFSTANKRQLVLPNERLGQICKLGMERGAAKWMSLYMFAFHSPLLSLYGLN